MREANGSAGTTRQTAQEKYGKYLESDSEIGGVPAGQHECPGIPEQPEAWPVKPLHKRVPWPPPGHDTDFWVSC